MPSSDDGFYDDLDDLYDSSLDHYDVLPEETPPEEPPPAGSSLSREFPKEPRTGHIYRFLVGDLLSGNIVEELPFSSATYGFLRNRPGGFSGSIARPNAKVTRDILDPGATALYVERDGVVLWGGIVWAVEPEAEAIRVGGEGFWSHFRKILHEGVPDPGRPGHNKLKRYNDVDQLDIVRDVIDYAQTYYPDTNLNVLVDANTSGVARDEVFRPWDRREIGDALEKMAELNQGFDFSLDVGWEQDRIVKRLHLFSSRGRLTDIVFDDHKNCTVRSRSIDAKDIVRQVTATGSGNGAALRRFTVQDDTLTGQRPLYQDQVSYSEVDDLTTLESRATKQVTRRRQPMETISIEVEIQKDLPIGSWRVGDYVRVRSDDPYEPVDDFYRITGWEVAVDDQGQETVNMDFGPIPA